MCCRPALHAFTFTFEGRTSGLQPALQGIGASASRPGWARPRPGNDQVQVADDLVIGLSSVWLGDKEAKFSQARRPSSSAAPVGAGSRLGSRGTRTPAATARWCPVRPVVIEPASRDAAVTAGRRRLLAAMPPGSMIISGEPGSLLGT